MSNLCIFHGDIASSYLLLIWRQYPICVSALSEGAIKRYIDFGFWVSGDEAGEGADNRWYTPVWRIDHGDCPSVNSRPLSSTRRSTYADSNQLSENALARK